MRNQNHAEIGLETPSGFKRKADELRTSWARLVESFPDDKELVSIAREFDTWHYEAIHESGLLAKIFTTGELDKWSRRYATEYERLTEANPKIKTTAPRPIDIITPEKPSRVSPWIWAIIAASGAMGLYSIAKIRKKT